MPQSIPGKWWRFYPWFPWQIRGQKGKAKKKASLKIDEPLNETRVSFGSGGRGQICNSDEIYFGQMGKIK